MIPRIRCLEQFSYEISYVHKSILYVRTNHKSYLRIGGPGVKPPQKKRYILPTVAHRTRVPSTVELKNVLYDEFESALNNTVDLIWLMQNVKLQRSNG